MDISELLPQQANGSNSIQHISADELAAIVQGSSDNVVVIDSRSFLEYNTCHILHAVSVCCSKIVKRRLQQDKIQVKELLSHTSQYDMLYSSTEIVVYDSNGFYDQVMAEFSQLPQDSFVLTLLSKLAQSFDVVKYLTGGFLRFQSCYPMLCEDKKRSQALTVLSQPCLSASNVGPTKILPWLFLGSQNDSLNKQILRDFNITYELNVSNSCPKSTCITDANFLRIPVNDNYSEKLLPHFPKAFHFLDLVRESSGCALVHCLAGISRSATIAIAYVMKHLEMSSDEAYRYVKSKRPSISPNFNFLGQLLEYEKQLQLDPTKIGSNNNHGGSSGSGPSLAFQVAAAAAAANQAPFGLTSPACCQSIQSERSQSGQSGGHVASFCSGAASQSCSS